MFSVFGLFLECPTLSFNQLQQYISLVLTVIILFEETSVLLGNLQVQVRISSSDAVEEVNAAETSVAAKVIPPWLKKQGASLSREEVSGSSALLEDKQEERKESRRSLQVNERTQVLLAVA